MRRGRGRLRLQRNERSQRGRRRRPGDENHDRQLRGIDEVFSRTDSSGTSRFPTDALGSTIALADGSGTVQTSYTYDPFGNPTITGATSSNTQQYNRARYYSPILQRFISQDPLGFGGDVNLYAYAGNSPANLADPSGLCPECAFIAGACLAGGIFGGYYGWTHARKDRWQKAASEGWPNNLSARTCRSHV